MTSARDEFHVFTSGMVRVPQWAVNIDGTEVHVWIHNNDRIRCSTNDHDLKLAAVGTLMSRGLLAYEGGKWVAE